MADAVLYPGAVTVRAFPDLCTVVGTSPWADRDDATYGRVTSNADATQLGTLQAPLPQAGFIPDLCTDVQLYVRASASATTASGQGVQVGVWDDTVGSMIGSVGVASHLVDGTFTSDGTLIADGTTHDYLYRWADVDSGFRHSFELLNINDGTPTWDPPSFATWVRDHATTLHVTLAQPDSLTYFELWVILVGAASGGRIHPYRARQRLYPIAPARRWPREAWTGNSSRRVDGYR